MLPLLRDYWLFSPGCMNRGSELRIKDLKILIDILWIGKTVRLESVEEKIEKLPIDYVLKKDLNNDLHEIRTWLRSINDKIDTLILSR